MGKKDIKVNTFDIKTDADAKALSFSLCTFREKVVPYYEEQKDLSNNDDTWVKYGRDGKYPQFLFNECYLKSTILQTLINGTSSYVMGDGIELNDLNESGEKYLYGKALQNIYWDEYTNEDGESLVDIVKRATIDYLIFGGCAILIKKNSYGQISDLRWLDFQNCRVNKSGKKVFYWPDGYDTKNNYTTYTAFNADKNAPVSIFYFKGHITRGVYPISLWNSAIASVLTSVEIGKFHLSTIRKNFAGNFIINYNDANYTEEQKKIIAQQVKQQFQGAENAGSVMLAFNNGKDNAVSVARIPEDSFDKKYDTLKESTMQEIFIAFGATPSLFGFNISGDVFSKEKFLEAFAIYNKTRIQSYQNDIERIFSRIFGVKKAFNFIPYKLTDDGEKIAENEDNNVNKDVIE